jgi:hypothetical protein
MWSVNPAAVESRYRSGGLAGRQSAAPSGERRARAGVRRVAVMIGICGVMSGCTATSRVQWDGPHVPAARPVAGPVFVMAPIVDRIGPPGNVARDLPAATQLVLDRILSIVRERYPAADMAEAGPYALPELAGYSHSVDGDVVTRREMDAARRAYESGATHLLVPTIEEWREMRTDDPIGAFLVPRSTVRIRLRLMGLRPASVAGIVTFENRARLTLNRPASGLLGERFRAVVLRLMGG